MMIAPANRCSVLRRLPRRNPESSLRLIRWAIVTGGVTWGVLIGRDLMGQTDLAPSQVAPACTLKDRFFEDEVWAKVGERTCLRCHNKNGDAAFSKQFPLEVAANDQLKNFWK